MSRWRQTLCGSVIKTSQSTAKNTAALYKENSKILTCGGSFLPHPQRNLFRQRIKSTMVHLPKEAYEVLLVQPYLETQRYNLISQPNQEEIDPLENTLRQFDLKLHK